MGRCCGGRGGKGRGGLREIRLLGVVMVAAGLLVLFLCIPGWAWTALIGEVLLAAGLWLATLGLW